MLSYLRATGAWSVSQSVRYICKIWYMCKKNTISLNGPEIYVRLYFIASFNSWSRVMFHHFQFSMYQCSGRGRVIWHALNTLFCFLTWEALLYHHPLNHYQFLLAMSLSNSFVQLPVLGSRLHWLNFYPRSKQPPKREKQRYIFVFLASLFPVCFSIFNLALGVLPERKFHV